MRVGIDLRGEASAERRIALAVETDRLGLWAVLLGGEQGTENTEAAIVATKTDHVQLAVDLDGDSDHPLTFAEELSVLDHLSQRRVVAIISGERQAPVADHVRRLLASEIVDGVALAPPPAQTLVPVWPYDDVAVVELSGDLDRDRSTIDDHRDRGVTHLFVTWPGPLPILARHLATRAATPDFPQLVADLADRLGSTRNLG